MKHRTVSGNLIEISEMSSEHLINTIKMLRWKTEAGILVRCGGGDTAEDMWYDDYYLHGEEARKHLNLAEYEAELKKRESSTYKERCQHGVKWENFCGSCGR